jgi:NAD(P)H-flavin reductase
MFMQRAKPASIAFADDPMRPTPFRVVASSRETDDTVTLECRAADDGVVHAFEPGQFNMVYAFGIGEVPISLSGDPQRTDAFVHTVRAVGGVTDALVALEPGDALGVRGPFGTAWPTGELEGHDVVIVAGGIGLAPLRPAIYTIAANRDRYGEVSVLYGARNPADLLFVEEIAGLACTHGFDFRVTVDSADETWRGTVGPVTVLIPRASFSPERTGALVCGPGVMMRFVLEEFADRGVPSDRVFISLVRTMQCGVGLCGRCLFGPTFICKDGPVLPFTSVERFARTPEW